MGVQADLCGDASDEVPSSDEPSHLFIIAWDPRLCTRAGFSMMAGVVLPLAAALRKLGPIQFDDNHRFGILF
jgi:hypothetical protein